MPRLMTCAAGVIVLSWMASSTITGVAQQPRTASPQQIDLAERLSAGKLRVVNRDVASVQGTRGIHLSDPIRHMHAVQYVAIPDYDWPLLREQFPEEFENPVDPTLEPTGWVPLRVVVEPSRIHIYVGQVKSPTLEMRKLGAYDRGMVGLWAGNGSDGDFANLRITPAK